MIATTLLRTTTSFNKLVPQFRTVVYPIATRTFATAAPPVPITEESKKRVTTTIDKDGICYVELSRPEKINAVDIHMFEAIARTAADLRKNQSIRVVIVSGQGRGFCSGLDVKNIMNKPKQQMDRLLQRPSGYGAEGNEIGNLAQDVSYLWREIPVPVITVVHGMCYGAGFQIALGGDFRFATPDCKFSIMETKWGLIPDMGAAVLLRELVRIDVAKELTMTGRIFEAPEAKELGLVTKVCEDPMQEAKDLAKQLVLRSPDALAYAKQMYQNTWRASEAHCLEVESTLQVRLLASWNQLASAARAFGWKIPYFGRKSK
eukprot:Nitzschia sp. Nitz4//scaffold35_size145790//140195//141148//NITZ4_003061-RA/size145790-processed-gene-0.250-mRNA-1//-1//CDS//3329549217//7946//frame0